MKYHLLVAGIFIILILAAGCSDDAGSDTSGTVTGTPVPSAQFSAGDIVARTATQTTNLWLIVAYDGKTDEYECAQVFKKPDGSFYRRDTKTDRLPRSDLEKLYPALVKHGTLTAVPIATPTTVPLTTATTSGSTGPDPEITSVTPNTGASGSSVTITNLAGKNFASGATVKLVGTSGSPIIASQVNAIDTKITCVFNLAGAEPGKRDVVVTNPDGKSSTLANGFTVNEEAPILSTIDPYSGVIGERLSLTLSGSNFKNPALVIFSRNSAEIRCENVEVHSATQITCVFPISAGTQPGEWDVIVRNVADRQNSTALKKFTISNAT